MMSQEVAETLDQAQVKKAVQALLAYEKTKGDAKSLLLNEHENVFLMLTVWKIPEREQYIKIGLPHGIRPETTEVCLFTRDEPKMSAEQTEAFYRKLLSKNGIKNVTQIISYKTLKKEYKPYEAKRRLLNNYDLFLADDRIRRLLPSHIGKHFYRSKRVPISVSLKDKNIAQTLKKVIQGTTLHVTSKGCCYSTRVGHTGMKTEELVENIKSASSVIGQKLPKNWKNIKILHLKTQKSVALPIYTSNISNVDDLDTLAVLDRKEQKPMKKRKIKKVKRTTETKVTQLTTAEVETNNAPMSVNANLKRKNKPGTAKTKEPGTVEDEDEEIPQLVPIADANISKGKRKKGDILKPTPKKETIVELTDKTPLSKKKSSTVQKTTDTKQKRSEAGMELTTPNKLKKNKNKKQTTKENAI